MSKNKLEKLLNSFYQISGMDISIIDSAHRSIAGCRYQGESFCSLIHKCPDCTDMCKASDKENLSSVTESSSGSIFLCPFGVTEAFIPLLSSDVLEGYAICSLGIVQGDGVYEDIVERVKRVYPDVDSKSLKAHLENLPKLTDAETEAYFSLLEMLGEHIVSHGLIPTQKPSIGQLTKQYIRNNLSNKITLADISWNLHCSTVTLTQRFKSEFGYSIMEYVTVKRMERARQLLTDTKNPLYEIASACGYQDVEYFSRAFKKQHGSAPGEWRRRATQ